MRSIWKRIRNKVFPSRYTGFERRVAERRKGREGTFEEWGPFSAWGVSRFNRKSVIPLDDETERALRRKNISKQRSIWNPFGFGSISMYRDERKKERRKNWPPKS